MKNSPLISIITPTYNHAKFISKTIDSVLTQTYTNWEMIIIDDGSSDNTKEIIMDYADRDTRIHYFYQSNKGVFRLSETYNLALQLCRGEYVAILEGDDFWEQEKLINYVAKINLDPDYVLIWGNANIFDSKTEKIMYVSPKDLVLPFINSEYFENSPPSSILGILYFENIIPAVTVMIKKTALELIGGFTSFKGFPLVDYPTILNLSLIGRFGFVDKSLSNWRIFPEQTTKKHIIDIALTKKEFVLDHYAKNSSIITSDINIGSIKRYSNNKIMKAYAISGRYKLISKMYGSARTDYMNCLLDTKTINILWRLRAIIGIIMSYFKLDVEWLAKFLKKKSFK